MSDAATILFGGSTPSTPPGTTSATPDDDGGAILFEQMVPPKPRDPAAPDANASQAEKLFANSPVHGDAERAIERSAMEDALQTPEQARSAAASWRAVWDRNGLTSTESAQVADLAISANRAPPDEATVVQWANDAKTAIAAEYGPQGVAQALEDAKALVSADPQLKAFLHSSGLGNHPTVVRMACAKARELRKAGRLPGQGT